MGTVSNYSVLSYLLKVIKNAGSIRVITPLYTSKRQWSLESNSAVQRGGDAQEDTSGDWREAGRRYTVKDFQHLITDKLMKERIRLLLRLHRTLLHQKKPAPIYLSSEDVVCLLSQPSVRKRFRYFEYLSYKEEKKLKLLRKAEKESEPAVASTSPHSDKTSGRLPSLHYTADSCNRYGLFNNAIFIRFTDRSMSRYYESRQIPAILFGQKLVFDFDYDQYMTRRECNKAAVDVKEVYGLNRRDRDPFHFYFCNAKPSNPTIEILNASLFHIRQHTVLTEVTEKSYLDLFPKENLVYLSPDGEETLDIFDHDAVYIIGVFVDKETKEGASYAKAKLEGIRTVRFPHNFFLPWEPDKAVALHLTDVLRMLLLLKHGEDWASTLNCTMKNLVAGEASQNVGDKLSV